MGRRLKPTTQPDPILREIFTEQERRRMSVRELSAACGMHRTTITHLRHPENGHGKRVYIDQVTRMAKVLGFKWPPKLEREE